MSFRHQYQKTKKKDTTAPLLTQCSTDISLEATSAEGAVAEYNKPIATDIVDGILDPEKVNCNLEADGSVVISTQTIFGIGDNVVTCTASDEAENSQDSETRCSFTVTVIAGI